jgi:hypothetical protein
MGPYPGYARTTGTSHSLPVDHEIVPPMPRMDYRALVEEALALEAEEARQAGRLGYMARVFALTSMPYRDPGDLRAWVRHNGHLTLKLIPDYQEDADGELRPAYPYGTIPRLLMAWMTTAAYLTKSPELSLGRSLSDFMGKIGLVPEGARPSGGRAGNVRRLRDQTDRLFSASITSKWEKGEAVIGERHDVAQHWQLWWSTKDPGAPTLWESSVTLSPGFYEQVVDGAFPIDLGALKVLRGSAMRLDIYCWLSHRMSYLRRPTVIPWELLRQQFGGNRRDTPQGRARFREDFVRELCRVHDLVYREARFEIMPSGLMLLPSPTHVARRSVR